MRETIAKSSLNSEELICVLNNSVDSPSSDCVLCFSNGSRRSFTNNLKNIILKTSPCLSPIDVLNGVDR